MSRWTWHEQFQISDVFGVLNEQFQNSNSLRADCSTATLCNPAPDATPIEQLNTAKNFVHDNSGEADARVDRKLNVGQSKHYNSCNQSKPQSGWALAGCKRVHTRATLTTETTQATLYMRLTRVLFLFFPSFFSFCIDCVCVCVCVCMWERLC